jgi:epoxyqueuosine reductase
VASLGPLEARERYEAWLSAGRHAGMAWLGSERHRERRADPARILPGLRSVVCVALCHSPARDGERDERLGRIGRYAAGEDYHHLMAERLEALSAAVTELLPGSRSLGYSDTGAILERGWAERAGLGWIGKHSGLLSQTLGSWFLLGELLIDQPLEPDPPLEREHCGTCTRCIAACPTGAIVAPYQLDARLCISYWTIEHRGAIPLEMRPRIGDWIFGCDICQEVCPWNSAAGLARDGAWSADHQMSTPSLLELSRGSDEELGAAIAGTPLTRAGVKGLRRNLGVALENLKSRS